MATKAKEFTGTKNHIQVSANKAVFPYLEVAKRMAERGEEEVLITGLGASISTVASVVDMLVANKFFTIAKIHTGRGEVKEARDTVPLLSVTLKKTANFDTLWATELKTRETEKAAREAAKDK